MSVPPLFKNFGKSATDLFKKKYDFDHQLKVLVKPGRSNELETGVVAPTGKTDLRGYAKYNCKCDTYGKGEVEIHTDANKESKANFKFDKLAQNAAVTLAVSSKDKAFKKTSGSVELEYAQHPFNFTSTLKSDLENHRLESSAVVAQNDLAVGGNLVADLSSGFQLADHNFGLQYSRPEYTAALVTENKAEVFTASYYQKVNPSTVVGSTVKYDTNKNQRVFQLGFDHELDFATTIRSKVELNSATPQTAVVATSVQHRLASPNLLLGVAAAFKVAQNRFESTDLGVSVTFGDN